MKLILILGLLGLTSGCSTFSHDECVQMNWSAKGHQDALKGLTAGQGQGYYERECRERHGVELNAAAYNSGYVNGIKEFCTPEFSYRFASQGGVYQGTCPEAAGAKVSDNYKSGRLLFLEKRVSELEGQVHSLNSEVSACQGNLSSCEGRVNSCSN